MDANNGMVRAFWPAMYQAISAANAAIAGGQSVLNDDNSAKVTPLIAEARFMRAYCYFHLVQIFGDIPYIDFFIENPDEVVDITKTPANEVWDGLIADFEFAKDNLPEKSDIRSRPSQGSAAAYLALSHLTLGNFQEAYNEAKYVIDNSGTFGYALDADFQDLFDATKADGLQEPIFSLDFLGQMDAYPIERDVLPALTGMRGRDNIEGWSVAVPTIEVYEDWDDRDYRKWVSFDTAAMIDGRMQSFENFGNPDARRPHCAKYFRFPGNASTSNYDSDHNYSQIRYAEVLLIAAEALNETSGGPNAEAEGYINQVRARARNAAGEMNEFPFDVTPGQNQAEFRNTVLEERRLELAFEAKRWYDIKRRQLGVELFTGPTSFEPHATFDPSRDYLMPLPGNQLLQSPNLAPQNPGY